MILHAQSQAYFKMQNVLIDDRRIWVDLYVYSLDIEDFVMLTRLQTALSRLRDSILAGRTMS